MATIIEEPVGGAKPNLAPEKPLKEAIRAAHPKPEDFLKFIRSKHSELYKEREDTWREIYAAAHLVSLFMRGKQFVQRGRLSNGWRPYADLRDTGLDELRGINLTRFYIDNVIVKWLNSAADLVVRAAKDTDQAILAARAGDIIIEHYENNWYTPSFRQKEATLAIVCGTYFRRIYYCDDGMTKARRPILGIETLKGSSVGYCAQCGFTGNGDQFENGMCPQCGSQTTDIANYPPVSIEVVKGMEEYATGSIKCESIPLYNLRYDLGETMETSPYLIYSRRIRRDVLKGQLRGLIELGRGKSQDPGLNAQTALAYAGPAIGGRSQSGVVNKADEQAQQYTDLVELWLQPEMYGHVSLDKEVQTASGTSIPAGPLINTFPHGMCVMGTDDMQTILYAFDEDHKCHWVSGQYYLDPISGAGDGLVDIIEIQRQFNLGNSQLFTQMRAQGTPAVMFDKDLISGDKTAYLGNPRMNIPVDTSRLPEGRGLPQSIFQLMPAQVPGHMVEYFHSFLNNMFQLIAHSTDFSGGMPGVNNQTATGAEIGQALANSLHVPRLQILAEVNRKTAVLALQLFKKYCKDETYLRISGKNDSEAGIWLRASDIDTDVRVEVVNESWLPQNGLERRERLKQFIQFFGNVMGLQEALASNPKLVGNLARLADVDIDVGDWNSTLRLCRMRIEQMKKTLPMAEQIASTMDPATIQAISDMGADPTVMYANMLLHALEPKPNIREQGLEMAAAYYQDWLTTDEGLKASPILREAVCALEDTCLRFVMQGGAQAAAQEPPPPMPMPGMPPEAGGAPPPAMPPDAADARGAQAAANMSAPAPGAMGEG